MSDLELDTASNNNVMSFPKRLEQGKNEQLNFDPDDLIGAMLNEFSENYLDNFSEELLEVRPEKRNLDLNEIDDIDTKYYLGQCELLLDELELKMKKIKYYSQELSKII